MTNFFFSEFSKSLSENRELTSTLEKEEPTYNVPITLADRADETESSKKCDDSTPPTLNCDTRIKTHAKQEEEVQHKTCLPGQAELDARNAPIDKLSQTYTGLNTLMSSSRNHSDEVTILLPSNLPPLEDPSVILLSPTPLRKTMSTHALLTPDKAYEDDYTDLESLAEDVKHVKKDKAQGILNHKLQDSISDMVAYQKYDGEEADKPFSHFHELKLQQKKHQQEFHQKLFQELEKKSSPAGPTVQSSVATALGTRFEVSAVPKPSPYELQPTGFNSVPSKSPQLSRRGSTNTWMDNSPFWSQSLPRPKRRHGI